MKYPDPIYDFSPEHAPNWEDDVMGKIDIGPGRRPIPNCDVYVELYPDSQEERASGVFPEWAKDRLLIADIQERLPFENHTFDFAYTRSVLEHLENPLAACLEIARIASAGYITFPSARREYTETMPIYHRWYIVSEPNKLIFIGREYGDKYKDIILSTDLDTGFLQWETKFAIDVYNS